MIGEHSNEVEGTEVEAAASTLGLCFLNANRHCSESCQAFNHDALEDLSLNACTIVQGFSELPLFTTALTELMVAVPDGVEE